MSLLSNIVWSPLDYAEAAVVAREASIELLERLAWVTLKPSVILDLGCGLGEMSVQLRERYVDARIVAIDSSDAMLQHARVLNSTTNLVCSLAEKLPLADASVDMIVANFLLPWQPMLKPAFKEWRRVLRPNGLLVFTALGPDTLKEFHSIVASDDMPQCVDMHDIGDFLLKEGFADPILDVNHYTLTYRDKDKLFAELQACGMLSNNGVMSAAKQLNPMDDGTYSVMYEVVYGHAWLPMREKQAPSGEVKVPISQIRRTPSA